MPPSSTTSAPFPLAHVCFACEGLFEEPPLKCESCSRCFHLECADVAHSAQPASKSPFHCPDCLAGIHRCLACGKYAGEDDEKNGIVRCSAPGCVSWYHRASSSDAGGGGRKKKKGKPRRFPCLPGFGGAAEDVRRYVCPRHACNGCGATVGMGAALRYCIRCPSTFCDACRPRDVHVLTTRHFACMRHGGTGLPPPPAALLRRVTGPGGRVHGVFGVRGKRRPRLWGPSPSDGAELLVTGATTADKAEGRRLLAKQKQKPRYNPFVSVATGGKGNAGGKARNKASGKAGGKAAAGQAPPYGGAGSQWSPRRSAAIAAAVTAAAATARRTAAHVGSKRPRNEPDGLLAGALDAAEPGDSDGGGACEGGAGRGDGGGGNDRGAGLDRPPKKQKRTVSLDQYRQQRAAISIPCPKQPTLAHWSTSDTRVEGIGDGWGGIGANDSSGTDDGTTARGHPANGAGNAPPAQLPRTAGPNGPSTPLLGGNLMQQLAATQSMLSSIGASTYGYQGGCAYEYYGDPNAHPQSS